MIQKFLIIFVIFSAYDVLPIYGLNGKPIVKLNMADRFIETYVNGRGQNDQCFAVYQPQLKAITNTYEVQHESCAKTAQNARNIIKNEVETKNAKVQQLNTNICDSFSECTLDHSNAYGFFKCNNEAAATAIPSLYSIQNISKDSVQYIAMKTELLTYDLNTCNGKSSQVYIEEYSRVYGKLKDCLNGKDSVGTTTSSTSSPEISEPSSTDFPLPPTVIDD